MGSFYRSPSSRANYWELVNDSIRKANNIVLKFIILGDFNTDVFNNPSQHLTNGYSKPAPALSTNKFTNQNYRNNKFMFRPDHYAKSTTSDTHGITPSYMQWSQRPLRVSQKHGDQEQTIQKNNI